jgi:NAD(P)-dependent dehydrogenase (short-subunit alcohol dehydrogenase family)
MMADTVAFPVLSAAELAECAEFSTHCSFAAGPIETAMLNRFAGTAERKAGLAATVPLNRVGRPEEIAEGFNFLRMTKERTSMNTHQTAPTQFIEAAQRQQKGETET